MQPLISTKLDLLPHEKLTAKILGSGFKSCVRNPTLVDLKYSEVGNSFLTKISRSSQLREFGQMLHKVNLGCSS